MERMNFCLKLLLILFVCILIHIFLLDAVWYNLTLSKYVTNNNNNSIYFLFSLISLFSLLTQTAFNLLLDYKLEIISTTTTATTAFDNAKRLVALAIWLASFLVLALFLAHLLFNEEHYSPDLTLYHAVPRNFAPPASASASLREKASNVRERFRERLNSMKGDGGRRTKLRDELGFVMAKKRIEKLKWLKVALNDLQYMYFRLKYFKFILTLLIVLALSLIKVCVKQQQQSDLEEEDFTSSSASNKKDQSNYDNQL